MNLARGILRLYRICDLLRIRNVLVSDVHRICDSRCICNKSRALVQGTALQLAHCLIEIFSTDPRCPLRYERLEDNLLAAACQLALVICFIGCGWIALFDAFVALSSAKAAASVMGFTSTTIIALPLVVITLSMVVLMGIITAALVHQDGNQPVMLLTETGMPPLLTFAEGKKWHLFLSHIWSTGQE